MSLFIIWDVVITYRDELLKHSMISFSVELKNGKWFMNSGEETYFLKIEAFSVDLDIW